MTLDLFNDDRSSGSSIRGLGQVVQAGHGLDAAHSSDLSKAQALMQSTWPIRANRNAKACIGEVFEMLQRVERALDPDVLRDRPRQWTERRVRSIWQHEARRIDSYEMNDLEAAAQGEALRELTNSIERAARMAAFLASRGTDFNGSAFDRLRQFFGRDHRA